MPRKLIYIFCQTLLIIGAQLRPFETTNIWEHVSTMMELLGSKQLNYQLIALSRSSLFFHSILISIHLIVSIIPTLFKVQMDDIWRNRYCPVGNRFWFDLLWTHKGEC